MSRKTKGAKRGPKPKLEDRPDAGALLAEVLDPGANLGAIAVREGVHRNTLRAWRDRNAPPEVREIILKAGGNAALEAVQLDVLTRFIDAIEKSHEMLKAAHAWLLDPADATRYSLAPRTTEIAIHVGPDGVREKTTLGELLNRAQVAAGGQPISLVENGTKVADTRELHLKAVIAMAGVLEKYGKASGQIKADPVAQVAVLVESPDFRAHLERLGDASERMCEPCHALLVATLGGQG